MRIELIELISEARNNLSELKGAHSIVGIGSHFAPDLSPNEQSDIDLIVLRETKFLVKKAVKYKCKLFDLTICSDKGLNLLIKSSNNKFHWQENIYFSNIVFDIDNDLKANFSLYNKEFFSQGLISQEKARLSILKIENILRKLTGTDLYEFNLAIESASLIEKLYFLMCYKSNERPYFHPIRRYNHIHEKFHSLAKILEIFKSGNGTKEKCVKINQECNLYLESNFYDFQKYGVFKKIEIKC